MDTRTRLTRKEVGDLIASVFQYNGQVPKEIGFYDVNGKVIDFFAEVVCGSPGLRVRTTPDNDEYENLHRMTEDAISNITRKSGKGR